MSPINFPQGIDLRLRAQQLTAILCFLRYLHHSVVASNRKASGLVRDNKSHSQGKIPLGSGNHVDSQHRSFCLKAGGPPYFSSLLYSQSPERHSSELCSWPTILVTVFETLEVSSSPISCRSMWDELHVLSYLLSPHSLNHNKPKQRTASEPARPTPASETLKNSIQSRNLFLAMLFDIWMCYTC